MFYGCSSLGVGIGTGSSGAKTLVVPSNANNFSNWGQSMFDYCGQTDFTGDPQPNGTYYFYDATQPQN
ncbi:MAG: hypothetical protein MJ002_08105 [Paludibacteraceae bacterium]|nr:hypothetical protein [Paludibacteraceae bacterium]